MPSEVEHARERPVRRHVDPLQGEQGEPDRHEQLPTGLPALAQSEVAAPAHAEVVVDEPDRGHADDERHERDPGAGEQRLLGADVRDQVSDQRADDDGDASHRRCTRLLLVRVREMGRRHESAGRCPSAQNTDQRGCGQDAQDERGTGTHEQRDHRCAPVRGAWSPRVRARRARLPFTSTVSPRWAKSAMASSCARGVGHLGDGNARGTGVSGERCRFGPAPRPARRPRPRPTRSPSAACSGSLSSPNSRISPSTEPAAGHVDGAARANAAAIDAGLALYESSSTTTPVGARSTSSRHPRGPHAGKPGHDVIERDARRQRNRGRQRRVDHLVGTAHLELDQTAAPRRLEPEPRAQLGVESHRRGPHLGPSLTRRHQEDARRCAAHELARRL